MDHYQLELVPGLFALTEVGFLFVNPLPSFGLLDTSDNRWTRFKTTIDRLQQDAAPNEKIKVVFLARHGQGYHNASAELHGHQAWLQTNSRIASNDDDRSGPDPNLTALGEQQALDVGRQWKAEVGAGMPLPTSFYTSPLSRSVRTLQLTFDHTDALARHPPLVIEDLREGLNILVERDWGYKELPYLGEIDGTIFFLDNQRSSRTDLGRRFPGYRFEAGFTERDECWTKEVLETTSEHAARTRKVLERLFDEDEATYVFLSAHGGTCLSAMSLFGLPLALPPTCATLPLVIRATRK